MVQHRQCKLAIRVTLLPQWCQLNRQWHKAQWVKTLNADDITINLEAATPSATVTRSFRQVSARHSVCYGVIYKIDIGVIIQLYNATMIMQFAVVQT